MAADHGATLTLTTISSPDPPALARFYGRLLGWEIDTDEPGWATLRNPAGPGRLGFHIEDEYAPPVWPSKPGQQLMMAHLEIREDDLEAGRADAQACGATLAEFQPQAASASTSTRTGTHSASTSRSSGQPAPNRADRRDR